MTFELWKEIWKHCHLPNVAKEQLPKSLSKRTIMAMMKTKLSPSEIAKIIDTAVDEIDQGSIKTIDELIYKALRK